MNRKELMLGDWVQIPKLKYDLGDGDFFNGFTQITKLERFELWTDALNEISYDEIYPIPLTEKIIERLGFSYVYGFWRLALIEEGHEWVIEMDPFVQDNKSIYYLTIEHRFDGCSIGGVDSLKVVNVHNLQNALRLCEVPEEIDLPNDEIFD